MNGILLKFDSHGAKRSVVSDNGSHSVVLVDTLSWRESCYWAARKRERGRGRRQELGDGRAAYALSSSQMDLSCSIDVNYAVDKKRSTVIMRRDDCS